MQVDLVDFSLLKLYYDNSEYILVALDVIFEKAFTAYSKSKSSSDIIEAFACVMPEIGKFQKVQRDIGHKFLNFLFQTWLKQHHVNHYNIQNFDTKKTIDRTFYTDF